MKYSFHPYHSYYQTRAQSEIATLQQLYPTASIEHFGSTSVPGLGGKGIIDISIAVTDREFDGIFEAISKSDYEYRSNSGVPNERYFFQKIIKYPNGRKQLFHLHLTKKGNKNMVECLSFRNYLKSHPTCAQEYSNIKHQAVLAAKKFYKKEDKKKAYMNTKKPVIEKILNEMKNSF